MCPSAAGLGWLGYRQGHAEHRHRRQRCERGTAELGCNPHLIDERERGRAIQSVIDRAGTQAEDVVLRALDDQSDYVRTVALSSALEAAFALPVDVLVRLATADPLASVRMYAMRALASNVEGADGTQRLNAIQEVASRDPDPTVRDKAAHLLQQLTNPASPEEGPPQ